MWDDLLALARPQLGVFATRQAFACGITADQLTGMVSRGVIQRWPRGVYAVAGAPITFERRVIAAQLAVGAEAIASHGAAARLLEFTQVLRSDRIELTVRRNRGSRVSIPGVTVHSTTRFRRADIVLDGLIPTMTVERTVCDLAHRLEDVRLRRVIHDLWRRDLTDPDSVAACLIGLGRIRGAARLRALFEDLHPDVLRARTTPESEPPTSSVVPASDIRS